MWFFGEVPLDQRRALVKDYLVDMSDSERQTALVKLSPHLDLMGLGQMRE